MKTLKFFLALAGMIAMTYLVISFLGIFLFFILLAADVSGWGFLATPMLGILRLPLWVHVICLGVSLFAVIYFRKEENDIYFNETIKSIIKKNKKS